MIKEKFSLIRENADLSEILSLTYIPLTVVFLELVLRIKYSGDFWAFLPVMLVFSAAFGIFVNTLCMLPKSEKARRILSGAAIFALCLYFTVESFVKSAYQVYMTTESIAEGTGGVLTDFLDTFLKAIKSGFFIIILLFLPFIHFVLNLLLKKLRLSIGVKYEHRKDVLIFSLMLMAALFTIGAASVSISPVMSGIYREAYNFDNASTAFGLITGTRLNIQYEVFGNPAADGFIIDIPEEPEVPSSPVAETPDEPEPEEKEYGYNILDIDFEKLISETSDQNLANTHRYVSSLSGTKQNEYTGLFEGKNLIMIAAESFSSEVIDEELTPTLYRLANNGIKFSDFYQPTWGGSTSTGEYSFLTGLVPTSGVSSIRKIAECDLSFTIGNKLKALGYTTGSYHNGTYTYYNRDKTHTKFGYDYFKAFGSGLEEGVNSSVWPASDLEMMEYTLSDYIDKEPFSVYYMSVSGHGFYANFNNSMSMKNRSYVEELDFSTTVKAYIAANLELEHALTYLVGELEKAGIADDTVIVICPDHYPYALEKGESWGNDMDYLGELYGYPVTNYMERDHNACIIWSGCFEDENKDMQTEISEPSYSLDILPTLCNLFGLDYDSRLLVGRDVLSDEGALVIWPDYSWKTALGYYNYTTRKFIPASEDITADEDYINAVNAAVKNKISYSKAVITYDYFGVVFGDNLE